MRGREIIKRLHAGERVYGTLAVSTSPHWPGALAPIGLDFIFIDTEHIAIERETLSWMCRTFSALGIAPIVRVPSPDPYEASMVVDGGSSGVIAPYVESAEQARALRGAVKFKPLKGVKLEAGLDDIDALEDDLVSYVEKRNADNMLILNIESVPAMEALDEILDVPGVDAVLIGPHDLSCSLGIPEQYDHPEFDRAVREIYSKARAKGVGAGMHFMFPQMGLEMDIEWIRAGGNLVIHSGDIIAASMHLGAEIAQLRAAVGDVAAVEPGEVVIV